MATFQTAKGLDITSGVTTTVTFETAMDSTDYNVIGRAYVTDAEGEEREIPCTISNLTVNGFDTAPTENCKFDYIAVIHGAYTR